MTIAQKAFLPGSDLTSSCVLQNVTTWLSMFKKTLWDAQTKPGGRSRVLRSCMEGKWLRQEGWRQKDQPAPLTRGWLLLCLGNHQLTNSQSSKSISCWRRALAFTPPHCRVSLAYLFNYHLWGRRQIANRDAELPVAACQIVFNKSALKRFCVMVCDCITVDALSWGLFQGYITHRWEASLL